MHYEVSAPSLKHFWGAFRSYKPPELDLELSSEDVVQQSLSRGFHSRGFPRLRFRRLLLFAFLAYLILLGSLRFLSAVVNAIDALFPDEVGWVLDHAAQFTPPRGLYEKWPTAIRPGVGPVACHSHNDYWQSVPLYSAINAGCISVEADIWLLDNEIYVGHSAPELTPERTLQQLYLDPLFNLLQKRNAVTIPADNSTGTSSTSTFTGVFSSFPEQTLVLLVDFKTDGAQLWSRLEQQLDHLRAADLLTHFNGVSLVERPLTVVASGNAPFDLIAANSTYRSIFYDAPLENLGDGRIEWPNPNRLPDAQRPPPNVFFKDDDFINSDSGAELVAQPALTPQDRSYSPFNSYYASASFTRAIGRVWGSRLTQGQLQTIRSHVRGAHRQGIRARYWGVPCWPIGLRNHIWHILMREGIDVLGTDDIPGATRRDWRRQKGWWQ